MPTQEEQVNLFVCEHVDWDPFNDQLLRLVNGKLPAYVHTRAALRPLKVKLCEKCTEEFEKKHENPSARWGRCDNRRSKGKGTQIGIIPKRMIAIIPES